MAEAGVRRMSTPSPVEPGWYVVAPRTQRSWDGTRWTDDVIHHDRPMTATALRQRTTRMMWAWVAIGVVAWVTFLVMLVAFGPGAAVPLAVLPLAGTAAIVAVSLSGSRLIAALPPA